MKINKLLSLLIIGILILTSCTSIKEEESMEQKTIAIAWRSDSSSSSVKKIIDYLSSFGSNVIMLDKTTTPDLTYYSDGSLSDDWLNYDFSLSAEAAYILWNTDSIIVSEEIDNVDLIVFTGGEDVSPTLYGDDFLLDEPVYNPERDASDFLTMRYALEHNIPILGICRGMQVLGVVEGASLIPDLPEYFEDRNLDDKKYCHRTKDGTYTFHNIEIEKDSFLDGVITNSVASSHHQALDPQKLGKCKVKAMRENVIEEIEIDSDSFILGIQFHPEYFIDQKESVELQDSLNLLKKILKEI